MDLTIDLAQALDPFHLDLVRYRHMCRDDLEVCCQYTDIIYSLVTGGTEYIVHGMYECIYVCLCVCMYVRTYVCTYVRTYVCN